MYMRKFILFFALMMAATTVFAANKGIPSEIFKDGKAKYLKSTNTLVLEEGFLFRQGKGLLTVKATINFPSRRTSAVRRLSARH